MTQTELNALSEQLQGELRALGIPISKKILPAVTVNTRAKRRLGCCIYRDSVYQIEVSAALMDDPQRLRTTLVHELLHTCPGCRNHGEKWKAYAGIVNQAWGMEITRTVPVEGDAEPLRHEEIKYIIQCQQCGAQITRYRKSKVVKAPWRYRCRCGGKLKVCQVK